MKIIESIKNDWIKQIKKLEKKKYRDLENLYLIEGEHLVEEAVNNAGLIHYIIVTEEAREVYQPLLQEVPDYQLVQVTEEIIKHLSSLPSAQPILAVVEKNKSFERETSTNHLLLLDNIQDPGNVGTMIRTADAAGFSGVVLGQGTADVYNSKVVRSMQGSQFHINIEEANLEEKIESLQADGYQVYATELNPEAISFKEIPTSKKIALVMGNEGQGVRPEILNLANETVYIPMRGQSESLNVAVAAGIIMFSI